MKKEKNIFKNINLLLFVLSIVVVVTFGYILIKFNAIPTNYLILLLIVLGVFYLIYGLFNFIWYKKKVALIIFDVVAVIFMIIQIFVMFKLNDTIEFIKNNFGNNSFTLVYNVVVKNDSNYNNIDDVKGKEISYYKDIDDDSKLQEQIKGLNVINYDNNVFDLLKSVITDNKIALVSSGFYDAMIEIDENYENETKIIATYKIVVNNSEDDINIDVTKKPFILFINGIDTRSGTLPARSLSDVNIVTAVNPVKKKLLMVAIPRDYYVQLHGTNGLKDKLTHSGTYGGVKETIDTIEDLFEIDINYYVRLNFNAVVNLVDAVQGITVVSDVTYPFNCHTNKNCTIKPGYNNVDGKCALAFARERKAYASGDRHRGENQEQVIAVLLNKITSSSALINDYSNILKALEGTFETNFSADDITSLIKMQIGDMAKWKVDTYNVNGEGDMTYTYSYPHQKLWVMNPDYKTVEIAKSKINQILKEG